MDSKEMKRRMQNEYFEYEGNRYYAGTQFKAKCGHGIIRDEIVIFIFHGYNDNCAMISYVEPNWRAKNGSAHFLNVSMDELKNMIIEIIPSNYYIELESKKKYIKDSDIPELFIAWIIYAVVMGILTIFNDRIIGWTAVSAYFFYWRYNKKEEESYYG